MFSITTIASSAMRPSAAAIPASVMRLIVWPAIASASPTIATVNGIAATAISVKRTLRRKTSRTSPASTTPMTIASRAPFTESETNRAWS